MKQERGFNPMDEDTKARIAALADLPDSKIDTTDIKEWTEQEFAEAVPFYNVYKPRKEQITARIDTDILLWLKSHGKGYHTLMNDLLRKEMLEEFKKMA